LTIETQRDLRLTQQGVAPRTFLYNADLMKLVHVSIKSRRDQRHRLLRLLNSAQVLDAVDQIATRIDPQDGKSRLVRESDLDIIKKALNRGA
jgi:hypothetical protein